MRAVGAGVVDEDVERLRAVGEERGDGGKVGNVEHGGGGSASDRGGGCLDLDGRCVRPA
jgi:hypothetical protein